MERVEVELDPGRPGARDGARVELVARSAVDAEGVQHLSEGEPRPGRAEQRLTTLADVPPDGHPACDATSHCGRVERRRHHANQGLGGATGVEHVARANDPGADACAEVIVSRDREDRPLGLGKRVPTDPPQRCARDHELTDEAGWQPGPGKCLGEGGPRGQLE